MRLTFLLLLTCSVAVPFGTGCDDGADADADRDADGDADGVEVGYPGRCVDAEDCCLEPPPMECTSGAWTPSCEGGTCAWACDPGPGVYETSCTAATECDCFPAPVRCSGTWRCDLGICLYYCD